MRLYRPIRRASFDRARSYIELGSVPGALHRPAYHRSAGERAATMGAVVVECNVSVFGTGKDDTSITDVEELHLVHFELVELRDGHGHTRTGLDALLVPLPCARVAMVDTYLVPVHQHAAHPPTGREQAKRGELESQHPDVGSADHPASHYPRDGDQGHGEQIHEHVPRRATLARAAWRDGEQVINEPRHCRHERGHDSGSRQVAPGRPPARAIR